VLKTAGIDCVSLANNHVLDFGYEGLLNMITSLDRTGIHHAGAGPDLKSASQPAIINCNGIRIGCVAFTDNEPVWEATTTRPGVFYVPVDLHDTRLETLLDVIADVRPQVDYLIVSAHWGSNWGYEPQAQHIPFAHTLVENGADIVFGHSCHVFQGIELYRSRPILYSCGDFIDDYRVDEIERNDESFIFIVEFKNGLERIRLYPTRIQNFHAQLARGTKAESIGVKMRWLCKSFDTISTWNRATDCLEIPIANHTEPDTFHRRLLTFIPCFL
jgi:poly-gamma-glutamate synthesis protein (capsule biosynthesis protein)